MKSTNQSGNAWPLVSRAKFRTIKPTKYIDPMVAIAGAKEPWAAVSSAGEQGAGGGEEAGEVEAKALGGGADLGGKQFWE